MVAGQTVGLEAWLWVGSIETVGQSPNVRFGSKADIAAPPINVRFTPESGHQNCLGLRSA